jgi:hypothetical protein
MTKQEALHHTILRKLGRLKVSLVTRLAVEGTSWLLMALVALVAVTFAFDYLLRLDQVELRLVIMAAAAGGVLYIAWRFLLSPLTVPMDSDSLALLVERHYGQLDDRLISALQFTDREDLIAAGMSPQLIQRVRSEASELAQPLNFSAVIERKRMWKTLVLALALVMVLGGFGAWQSDLMAIWFKRNVLFSTSEFYPQETYLVVEGGGDFKVHRGESLTVMVRPRPDSRVVPPRITVHAEYPDAPRTQRQVTYNADEDAYVVRFESVQEEFEFYVTGGDDRLDRLNPHRVLLLETAEMVDVTYAVVYPDYTNQEPQRRIFPNMPDILSVPAAGELEIRGRTTLPVRNAQIYVNGWPAGVIKPQPGSNGLRWIGKLPVGSFNLPSVGSVIGDAAILPEAMGLLGALEQPLRGPAVALGSLARGVQSKLKVVVSLTDAEDYSRNALELNVVVLQDAPAEFSKFDAREVSSLVTNQVQIPLYMEILDAYGLEDVRIFAAIDQGPFAPLGDPIRPATANASRMNTTHVVDLAQLDLQPGSTVRIQAEVRDSMPRDYGGPNVTTSRVLSFNIVSQQMLEEQLLQRIREAAALFSEAVSNQKLATAKTKSARSAIEGENEVSAAARQRIIDSGEIQGTVGTEVQNFADKLRGIVAEMERNNSGSAEQRTQFREYVIEPLEGKIAEQIETARKGLKQLAPQEDPRKASDEAAQIAQLQDGLVQELTHIGTNVVKFADRQQLGAELLNIIAELEKIQQNIKDKVDNPPLPIFNE